MSWDKASDRSKAASDGRFVSLKDDGDKVVGVFCGEPHVHELVWNEKKEGYEKFDAKLHEGKTTTPRFAINIFVMPDEKMRIMELNNQAFKQVLAVKDKYGLDNWAFEISRTGKKGDTKTTYSVLPETKLDDAQKKKVAEAKLHDLTKASEETGDDGGKSDMSSHDKKRGGGDAKAEPASDTISTDESQSLINRLKALGSEKAKEFLAKFGVKQVKQVKKGDLAAAKTFVDELEGKKPAAAEEVDPFAD